MQKTRKRKSSYSIKFKALRGIKTGKETYKRGNVYKVKVMLTPKELCKVIHDKDMNILEIKKEVAKKCKRKTKKVVKSRRRLKHS